MLNYLVKRMLLIPITLFFIVLVNFAVINLAPGEPTTVTEISTEGMATRSEGGQVDPSQDRYLQFREFYGLTLPLILNTWPFLSEASVIDNLKRLTYERDTMSALAYDKLRISLGDQARFIMPILLSVIEEKETPVPLYKTAYSLFLRGTFRLGYPGSHLTAAQKAENKKIGEDKDFFSLPRSPKELSLWYQKNKFWYGFEPSFGQKVYNLFFETKFFRYLSRVLKLDFGVMRNDPDKTVISEVVKRFKYSLTLSIIPMVITLFLCSFFGFLMAIKQGTAADHSLNVLFLILYAIPIFVAAPFLIENVALHHNFPFTDTPIPLSGFTSPDSLYDKMTSKEKLFDILQHIALPLLAILYGGFAAQTRLTRTAVLEVKRQDYVRTAFVKGVGFWSLLFRHIGRNAAITIVTSIAGSLGIVLGGSLIVETLFEIDGFGKFFYDAILNRDYNVIMFSALSGSFLTLAGYVAGDIAYMLLDPRVSLHE